MARAGQVGVRIGLGVLNAFSLLLAFNLWWLRLSDRLAGEVDAPEIILLYAVTTGAISAVALAAAAIAVKLKWVAAWWLAIPAVTLLAGIVGVCGVAGDL